MKIFRIGMIAVAAYIVFFQSSIGATETKENQFYSVKKIEFSELPDQWIACDLKFSEPNPSLDQITATTRNLKFSLSQFYRIDARGGVEVYDLREVSPWKSINSPSLTYTYHLKDVVKPHSGTRADIFGSFLQDNRVFGDYIMKVGFGDNEQINFTFSPVSAKLF